MRNLEGSIKREYGIISSEVLAPRRADEDMSRYDLDSDGLTISYASYDEYERAELLSRLGRADHDDIARRLLSEWLGNSIKIDVSQSDGRSAADLDQYMDYLTSELYLSAARIFSGDPHGMERPDRLLTTLTREVTLRSEHIVWNLNDPCL